MIRTSRRDFVRFAGVGLLSSALLAACGGAATQVAPTTAPAVAPTVAPTVAATTAPATVAPASPTTSAATPTREAAATVAPTANANASTGESLKPKVAPTTAPAAQATAAGGAKPASGGPTPPKSRYLVEALSKVEPTPVPAPTRKGKADPSVPVDVYATELVTDLVALGESMGRIEEIIKAVEADTLSDAEIVARVQKEASILNGVYTRQVARDYPPALKSIDDLFAESTRYASRMMDSFVLLLKTGDEKYLTEVEQHAGKFEFFFNELMVKLR